MGKKNRLIKVVGVGTAIVISNMTIAAAEKTPDAGSNSYHAAKTKDIKIGNKQILLTYQSAFPMGITIKHQDKQFNSVTNFRPLTDQKIAQAQLNSPDNVSPEILKPAQQPIPNTEQLNPSGNPLSFPTKPGEVEVDTEKPITLEQALEISLKNNQEIQQARLQIESDAAALRQQQAALFPTFGLTTSFTYSDDAFLDGPLQQTINNRTQEGIDAGLSPQDAREFTEDGITDSGGSINSNSADYNGGVALNYDIYTGGLRGASIRAAKKQLRNTELALEVAVEQVRLETAFNYYDLQNSDAQVEIQNAAVEDASQTLKDAQLLERAGLGTRFDVLRAEVELSQAQQNLNTAIADQNISRRQLAETLSVSHDTELSTADAIEEAGIWNLELAESIVQAFKNRAELEQFLLQKEISEEQRKIALSSIRPTVSASADYTANNDFEDNFNFSDRYSVGVNVQWALFDGGEARAGARQAEKGAEIAETQFADQRNQIRFAVEQAFFQLESNKSNIGTAAKEVELAVESLRLARLRFQAGVGTQTDVIDAQTQLTTARGSLLSSITDYNQSYVTLQREVSNLPNNVLQDLP